MTLSTDVYVLDQVDPEEVFRFCQSLLTKYDDPHYRTPEQQQSRAQQDESYTGTPGVWEVRPDNPWSRDNLPHQGLPEWLMTAYRPDGPLRAEAAGHDDDCDPDCEGTYHDRACYMSIDFDTAYGYRDARGWGCGDLHAALVGELGDWLTAKSVRWEWRNEFTGEVHTGRDGLSNLGAQGAEAGRWLATEALPAIIAHAAGGAS